MMIIKRTLHSWCKQTFELAKKANKPLLVTSYAGSALCEKTKLNFSSQDLQTDLDSFVRVSLNSRMQRNADCALMQFLKLRSGTGGWPLTVVLSPRSGQPFMACSYLDRDSMASFLKNARTAWAQNASECEVIGSHATETLRKRGISSTLDGEQPNVDQLKEDAMLQYNYLADNLPRFIMGNALAKMDPEFRATILKDISRSGMVDHIYSGVFSYCLSNDWHLPSFYKRLKDQATLLNAVNAYYRSCSASNEAVDKDIEYLGRSLVQSCQKMLTYKPAVVAKPYIWTYQEFHKALSPLSLVERDIAQEYWGVNHEGNIHEHYTKLGSILGDLYAQNVLSKYRKPSEVAETFGVSKEKVLWVISQSRELLKNYREPPYTQRGTDPPLHSLGLALSALSQCPLPEAEKVSEAFATKLASKPVEGDVCEDYANVIAGFLSCYHKTGENKWLELSLKWQEAQNRVFSDTCGYFYGKADELLYIRPKFWEDSSEPNYQAVSAQNLAQLAKYEPHYADKSSEIISNGLQLAKSSPLAYLSYC